jgi:hypothetical protein
MTALVCLFCDQSNPAAAKFCNECGTPLHFRPCPQCDGINARSASDCYRCGAAFAPLAADGAPAPAPPDPAAVAQTVAPGDPWAYLVPGSEPASFASASLDVGGAAESPALTPATAWLRRTARPAAALAALALVSAAAWFMTRPAATVVAQERIEPVAASVAAQAPFASMPTPGTADRAETETAVAVRPASVEVAGSLPGPQAQAADAPSRGTPAAAAPLPRASGEALPARVAKAATADRARGSAGKPAKAKPVPAKAKRSAAKKSYAATTRASGRPASGGGVKSASKQSPNKSRDKRVAVAAAAQPQTPAPCPEVRAMLTTCDLRTLAKGN